MKLEQSFEIQAPLEQVWQALIDLERVAPCLPGAAITDRDPDGTYHGTFVVKLGPATASYNGTVSVEITDSDGHVATLHAKGTDKRGQGGATATIVNRLSASGDGTRIEASTDMAITGRLARFGRPGMIQDVSNRMMKEFASCLQQRLVVEQAAPAATQEALAPVGGESSAEPDLTRVSGPGAASPGVPQEGVVAGEQASDLSADLVAEGREAAAVHVSAASPTGAPTGMAGGALSTPPATDATGGVSGVRPEGAQPPPTQPQFEAAPPVLGFSLMAGVLGDQVKRNSTPIAAALGVLIALLFVRSRRR